MKASKIIASGEIFQLSHPQLEKSGYFGIDEILYSILVKRNFGEKHL